MGPSPAQVARIAKATGCQVVIDQPLDDGTVAQHIECRGHKAKVRLLAALSDFDAKDPAQVAELRTLAEHIFGGRQLSPRQKAESLLAYTQQNVTQTLESVETFTPAWRTYKTRSGDCDDQARALGALMQVAGLQSSMATLGDPPTHVAPKVLIDGEWIWADSSVPGARLGEHPRAAVERLGMRRPDVGLSGPVDDIKQAASEYARDGVALGQLGLAAAYVHTGSKGWAWAGAALGAVEFALPDRRKENRRFTASDAANFAFAPIVLSEERAPALAFPVVAAAQYGALKSRYGARGLWVATAAAVVIATIIE